MQTPPPVELLADCPWCQLESGALERYDRGVAACRLGLPALSRCRLCGASAEGRLEPEPGRAVDLTLVPANRCPSCSAALTPEALGAHRCAACGVEAYLAQVAPSRPLGLLAHLEAALDAWAREDGFAGRDELLAATFVAPSTGELLKLLHAGEPLQTVMDPFAMAYGSGGGSQAVSAAGPVAFVRRATPPPLATGAGIPAPPRALVYPLVSICAADGELHPKERAFVDHFLASEGLAPLADDEFRVHPPNEVAHFVPKERRERLVELMCETAMVDGMPDGSELRVAHEYAGAWGIDHARVEEWAAHYHRKHVSRARYLWLQLRQYLLVGAWTPRQEQDGPEVEEQLEGRAR